MNAEERVRAAWECVGIQWANIGGKRYGMAHSNGLGIPLQGFLTEDEIWSAAAAFTDERLKQVAEIEEEIAIQREFVMLPLPEHLVYERTWRRLQAIREELRRGMK